MEFFCRLWVVFCCAGNGPYTSISESESSNLIDSRLRLVLDADKWLSGEEGGGDEGVPECAGNGPYTSISESESSKTDSRLRLVLDADKWLIGEEGGGNDDAPESRDGMSNRVDDWDDWV